MFKTISIVWHFLLDVHRCRRPDGSRQLLHGHGRFLGAGVNWVLRNGGLASAVSHVAGLCIVAWIDTQRRAGTRSHDRRVATDATPDIAGLSLFVTTSPTVSW